MPRTVWLASYPKSGNTWFRFFIANLLHPGGEPLDLNNLPVSTPIASSRSHFDNLLGIPSALLNPAEIARLRPAADRELSCTWLEPLLLRKVHDAYTWLGDGQPMLGRSPDFAAIYIVRDPWDVAVSMTNHFDYTVNEAVDRLCTSDFTLARSHKGLSNQLAQRLLSWEGHVMSWLDAPLSLHLMRYEEMRNEPVRVFRGAVRFLGLPHDDEAIEAALDACRFERLQSQERDRRFNEAPRHTRQFFRSGKVGEGLATLGADQLARLAAMKAKVDLAIAARKAAS